MRALLVGSILVLGLWGCSENEDVPPIPTSTVTTVTETSTTTDTLETTTTTTWDVNADVS